MQCPDWPPLPTPPLVLVVAIYGSLFAIPAGIAAVHYVKVWKKLAEYDRAAKAYPEF